MNEQKKVLYISIAVVFICGLILGGIAVSGVYTSRTRQTDRELEECRARLSEVSGELGRADGRIEQCQTIVEGMSAELRDTGNTINGIIQGLEFVREQVQILEGLLFYDADVVSGGNGNYIQAEQ